MLFEKKENFANKRVCIFKTRRLDLKWIERHEMD